MHVQIFVNFLWVVLKLDIARIFVSIHMCSWFVTYALCMKQQIAQDYVNSAAREVLMKKSHTWLAKL